MVTRSPASQAEIPSAGGLRAVPPGRLATVAAAALVYLVGVPLVLSGHPYWLNVLTNASVLSLIVPGVGQFYNGDFLRGLFWLIVTPGLWIGSGGLLGWICHVIAAITAYRRATWRNQVVA